MATTSPAPQQADIFIHVSRTNKDLIEGLARSLNKTITKIQLLEWKATGTSNNPSTSGVYTNEVVWLKYTFDTGSTLVPTQLPQKTSSTSADQIWKVMLNVEKPQVVLQDSTKTTVNSSELSGNLRSNPTLLATSKVHAGSLFGMRFALHANPTDDTEITYSNLYLWLRVDLLSSPY